MSEKSSRPVLIIAGPTAAGKTQLSIELSQQLPIEIISADARQVYRHLNIGTSKPTPEQQHVCKHHCIDLIEPWEPYNASLYASDARKAIDSVSLDKLPVFVGGSGLYVSAAIDGFSHEHTEPDEAIRTQLLNMLNTNGRDWLYNELVNSDPRAAERYSDRNPRRVMRALEYIHSSGNLFSSTWDVKRSAANVNALFVVVSQPVEILNSVIDTRCEFMWDNGLIEETEHVLKMGVSPGAQSMQTVGYREAVSFINKTVSESDALDMMKTSTRQYAKRQRTWFRRDQRYQWLISPGTTDVITLLRGDPQFHSFVV